ncbi:MAG: DUF4845 domain-containing protein [Pseudomonadota bacterium]
MWNVNQRTAAPATRAQQSGMTTLGIIILVCFIGLFVYAGLRLFPVFMEDSKISATFVSVEEELSGKDASKREIANAIYKRFDVDSVRVIESKDVIITRVDGGYDLEANYQNIVPFIANVSFSVDFKHKTTIVR